MPPAPKKILVVDDEPDAVQGVAAMLEAGGYTVVSAPNGDAGLAAARKEKPDLILMDVQMPGKNGFEIFNELVQDEVLRRIPVCFLTGVGEKLGVRFSAADVRSYYGVEPAGYLEKPVESDRLLRRVGAILGK
ncbi:MAG: response regulator [Planctomycetota bacterium]